MRHQGTIGLVLFDVVNPFFTELAAVVEERVAVEGFDIRIADSGGDVGREAAEAERLVAQGVRGVLIAPVEGAGSHLDELRVRDVPVVLVGAVAEREDVPSVTVDGELGGYLAAEHLLENGHRRLFMVTGPLGAQFRDRLTGARRAVRAVDGAKLHVLPVAAPTVGQGLAVGEEILALGRRPDAVIAANDLLAVGVLKALTVRGGARVPEDVAIIGYDDLDMAASASVPLTSVRQPRRRMAVIAAELLLAAIRGVPAGPPIRLEPELVVRASTTRPRALPDASPARSGSTGF